MVKFTETVNNHAYKLYRISTDSGGPLILKIRECLSFGLDIGNPRILLRVTDHDFLNKLNEIKSDFPGGYMYKVGDTISCTLPPTAMLWRGGSFKGHPVTGTPANAEVEVESILVTRSSKALRISVKNVTFL